MSDFRLEVFYTVAKRLSFTKAASALFITQPAVTKHIHELEQQYDNKLFERKGNKIQLTGAGELLLKHTELLFDIYRNIDFDMNALVQKKEGILHLGASTTVSQYVIAPMLAGFRNKFRGIELNLITGNTEQVEKALLDKEIQLGIIEGRSRHQEISYIEFIRDEIVLVCGKDHPMAKKSELSREMLLENSFVMREQGSGTLEVIDYALKEIGVRAADLKVEIQLGSTESIKSYLMHSDSLAFISVHALTSELQSGLLRIVDVSGLTIERNFYFIHLHGKLDGLSEVFLRYARLFHNLK
ncbi:LysR family transcriptional regulator [Pedobacter cryoconitis]|uniref:DNA-binding transcriptional LysR family regulator n=1 Tax=Pedobacter cryoconitis TaxID=188932 RepID=A0A7X0MK07_9SPHI|nr:LysR family transcriptional regulator [Pedobacter cryoconitis]MBB6502067.1 DNA-binding transcriptional LysR family regulator [Pedobacter cryoconitis]